MVLSSFYPPPFSFQETRRYSELDVNSTVSLASCIDHLYTSCREYLSLLVLRRTISCKTRTIVESFNGLFDESFNGLFCGVLSI